MSDVYKKAAEAFLENITAEKRAKEEKAAAAEQQWNL